MGLWPRLKVFLEWLNTPSRPSSLTWNVAMLAFFTVTTVSIILLFVPLPSDRYLYLFVELILGLGSLPGLYYSFLEYASIDEANPVAARIGDVMSGIVIIFIAFGVGLPSINNMAKVFGPEIPFYPILRRVRIVTDLGAGLVFGASALVVKKKGLHATTLEEANLPNHSRRSLGGILEGVGLLLMLLGLVLGLFSFLALEGLVLLVLGLVILPVGWLRKGFER